MLLFLAVSFAPFLVIAPLIGAVYDRAAGGRRTVIQLVAGAGVVLAVLMAFSIDSLTLFPLVFAALVLQKTYLVSKQAIVPSIVRSESELVEANSKLGVIAGITGFVAIIPAALIQVTPFKGWGTLLYSGVLFGYGLASVKRLPADVVAAAPASPPSARSCTRSPLQMAAGATMMLRAAVGFGVLPAGVLAADPVGGHVLVRHRRRPRGDRHDGGNAIAPRVRAGLREELMIAGALAIAAVGGLLPCSSAALALVC